MKSGINVLISGRSGFLLKNIDIPKDWNVIDYEHNKSYSNIDLVIHFASPSDSFEFQNKQKMAETMIDMTIKMINESLSNNVKFIFASSMAAEFLEDDYGIYKKAMEQYIQGRCNNYSILRIPRVYGKDKTKGLMRKINYGKIDNWSKEVEYIDISQFKEWFLESLNNCGIINYDKEKRRNTIEEIKHIYC